MKKILLTIITLSLSLSAVPASAVSFSANSSSYESKVLLIVPKATLGQKNALATAQRYLKYSAFSKKGLYDQLKYEGYTNSEAKYGVNNVRVNWNTQAYKKAKSYLKYSSFSRSGLIEQLLYEGFTQSQATYGVNKVGL